MFTRFAYITFLFVKLSPCAFELISRVVTNDAMLNDVTWMRVSVSHSLRVRLLQWYSLITTYAGYDPRTITVWFNYDRNFYLWCISFFNVTELIRWRLCLPRARSDASAWSWLTRRPRPASITPTTVLCVKQRKQVCKTVSLLQKLRKCDYIDTLHVSCNGLHRVKNAAKPQHTDPLLRSLRQPTP